MIWLRKLRGAYRLWMGFCPSCKSNAPEIDHCEVCRHGWRFSHKDRDASLDDAERAIWRRYVERGYR